MSFPATITKRRNGEETRGFALVISLSLMAFILLLLVSLTALVRVESRSASIATEQLAARQNAVLGMMVALGDLQQLTGPDRRSTAPAARLDGDPDTVPIDGLAQPRWTGVWRLPEDSSSPDGVDPQAAPERLAWLVSSDPSAPADPATDPTDPVVLASAVDDPDDDPLFEFPAVEASKRFFETGGEDAYAYWIDDEGAKAKLNAVAPNYDVGGSPRIPLGNGAAAFEQLAGGLENASNWLPGFPFTFDTTPPIRQAIAPADPDDPVRLAAELLPHTTLFGHGVLADSLRGGLKLDLSAILAMDAGTFDNEIITPLLPGERIYENYLAGQPNGQGPRWELLRLYESLGEGVTGENAATIRPEQAAGPRVTRPGIFPVIERFQLYVALRLSGNQTPSDSDATYRPRIYYLPALVLWNPYDRPLTAPDGLRLRWLSQGNLIFAYDYAAGTYVSNNWVPFRTDTKSPELTGEFPAVLDNNAVRFNLRGSPGENSFTLAPGEARVFTLDRNSRGSGGTKTLYPGFRGFGFYEDASQAFTVPEVNTNNGDPIYLDIKTRTGGSNPRDFPPFNLHLETNGGTSLQEVKNLRWGRDQRSEANRRTVSELGNHTFGTDPNGSQPFELIPGTLPPDNLEIPDSVTFPFPTGYEIGLRNPDPKIAGDVSYTPLGERLLAFNNPRGAVSTDPPEGNRGSSRRYYQSILFENLNLGYQAQDNYPIDRWGTDDSSTFVGYSDRTGSGQQRFALFHLPAGDEPLPSVGALRHLDLVGNNRSLVYATGGGSHDNEGWRKRSAGPAFAIGEARADPYIPLDAYFNIQGNGNLVHADHSWLANRQIWDRFFVSTVPESGPLAFPLPNGRIVPVDESNDATPADPAPYREAQSAAARLWTDGAFNINSVSVPAWKALLAHFVGQPVATENNGIFQEADTAPLPDLPEPFAGPYTGGDSSTADLYTGFRTLDPDEIDALAREIVRQIKLRGPFTSLADFVNRSIVEAANVPAGLTAHAEDGSNLPQLPTTAELAEDPRLYGLLQAAIETAGLNDGLYDGSLGSGAGAYVGQDTGPFINTNDGRLAIPAGLGPFLEGAPGHLTQGKLLQRLGPILSARSDTFRIRAYGETSDPVSGNASATAYCEAIVQRLPDYVDTDADTPETRPDALTSETNRNFGRQYRVIAFRWLTEEEL